MEEAASHCTRDDEVDMILGLVELQRGSLVKEVEKYCRERGE
jgi:hypothetical protein